MALIDEARLNRIQETSCPEGAVLIEAYGAEHDSLRVYEFRNKKFMHIVKRGDQRTFEFQNLPEDVLQKVIELRENANRAKLMNEKRLGWVNKL